KFTESEGELISRLDIWLYFLRHAQKMDTEAVPSRLQHPLVLQALEDLKVISQTELERERYEARRKWQLDYNSGLSAARREGREEGQAQGREEGRVEGRRIEIIRSIQFCEGLLGRPQTPAADLTRSSVEELAHLSERLQQEV